MPLGHSSFSLIFNLFVVVSLTFGVATQSTQSTQSAQPQPLHPFCTWPNVRARGIHDLSAFLQDALPVGTIANGSCIFNPALVHVSGNTYLVSVRLYLSLNPSRRCQPGSSDRPPKNDEFKGRKTNILALVKVNSNQYNARLDFELIGHYGRIFGHLYLRMLDEAKVATSLQVAVSRILIMCKDDQQCDIAVGFPNGLHYAKSRKFDKNWCPLNGTALMAYPVYGSFARGFFNWSNYDAPIPHDHFIANKTTEEYFSRFAVAFKGYMTYSGGTPAILEDSGTTYLAVGHLRMVNGCFHAQGLPRWAVKPLSSLMEHGLITFSASPPYHITHISHSFIPYSPNHYGVVFPMGLDRLGDSFLVSYGDSDQSAKLLVLDASAIHAALLPLDSFLADLTAYQMCSLPCWWEGGACS
ncbi:hypothetical protein TSOC_012618 [Tetrabaena socialis]|uniref:Uncharacterized protein n=1 Tax=Tetrabaena socialis TaxID=47790 RepID=A0A2J7ZMK2_9CHLO|nr:hypothetical protein TSOC_012618 [Tetrabaena socialis]|eukprot:PNH01494.1 hypothetical protein TSOC_012618 [Tetrabaena socialis]